MRTLLLSLILLLGSLFAKAQALTTKDLKGNWTMVAFEMSGIYYEWGKDSMVLSRTLKAQVDPAKEEEVIAEIKQRLKPYIDGSLKITDKEYAQSLMGDNADGTYTLIQKDGAQYIRVVNNNKNKDIDELKVQKMKGWLYISMNTEEGETILIFEKD